MSLNGADYSIPNHGGNDTITLYNNNGGNVYTGTIPSSGNNTGATFNYYTATVTAANDLTLTHTVTATGQTTQVPVGPVQQSSHTHILWTNTSGQVSLWSRGSDNSLSHKEYGPFAGWTAKAVSDGPDGVAHILWNHSPDGQVALWDIGSSGVPVAAIYGPFPGWAAIDISSGP